jgi:cation diffusion facilitator CzcD-associated flavoprotein CzcO
LARCLLAEKAFDVIDVFEQRNNVGGIWNSSGTAQSSKIPIPQTNPRYGLEGVHDGSHNTGNANRDRHNRQRLEFETPLYDNLEANIPKFLMAYSDKPFPADAPLFPKHRMVLKYLEEYAEEVRHLIRFQTQVLDVRLHTDDERGGSDRWEVTALDLQSRNATTAYYDAVVVASGHYTIPHVPDIKGVGDWNEAYRGTIIHSKAYRKPDAFKDKKVLIIGNSASGVDIAAQISRFCKQPLLLSSRSGSMFAQAAPWKNLPEIAEFIFPDTLEDTVGSCSDGQYRAVRFVDGSIETHIDAVVFATGYFFSFPFLLNLEPPIITDGFRTQDVYQHIFHIEHPTLAFPVLNLKVIPFPLAETQCAAIARVWSGRLSLPSKKEMRDWEREVIQDRGNGKSFHVLKFPLDAETLNELERWVSSAPRVDGLENGGNGKMGTFWNEKAIWMRSKFPQIKKAYAERGENRFEVRTAEELGFDYERCKEEENNHI